MRVLVGGIDVARLGEVGRMKREKRKRDSSPRKSAGNKTIKSLNDAMGMRMEIGWGELRTT